MGDVYLAEDTRLKRKVALKQLSAKLGDDKEYARRFVREAQAASALNQPNILTIYEIGIFDGRQFIAAEFVEGENLREKLRRGSLAIGEALEVAVQMVSALAAAHEIGIVHRDVKPENIMLRRDGLVKVVDFGLAKLVAGSQAVAAEAEDTTQFQTRENSVLGTTAYMSPEQTRGQPTDARTDLWSAGCVLYELITGRQPFEGASASDRVAAILRQEPAPLAYYVGEVPEELEQIIARALTKEREARYQTANEMLADLRRLKRSLEVSAEAADERRKLESKRAASSENSSAAATRIFNVARKERPRPFSALSRRSLYALALCVLLLGSVSLYIFKFRRTSPASPIQIKSVVVLPLKNIGGDAQDEYLSDGITDELITKLTKLKTVRVVSPSVAMRYKNSTKDAAEIGRELNVEAVIEGAVRKIGTRFRLSIHLVNAQNGFEIWADNDFESELRDLLEAQRQIAEAVASRLKGQLTPQERDIVASDSTRNADAYELFLRGKQQFRLREFQLARDLFDRAVALDPNFADAYAWRGLAVYRQFADGFGDRAKLDAALSDVNRALQFDPNLISARRTLIYISHSTGQYEEALKQGKQALETNAEDFDAIEGAALAYFRAGMMNKAIPFYQRAVAADPTNASLRSALARCYLHTGEYQKGIDVLSPVLNQGGRWMAMHNYRGLRQFDKAIEMGKLLTAENRENDAVWLDFGVVLKQAGKTEQAKEVWTEGAKHLEPKVAAFENVRTRVWLGHTYAQLGEREKALTHANRALALEPYDAWTLYQAGEIHAVLNNRREAVGYVKRAIAHGWLGVHYIDYQLDPNGAGLLANLSDDAEFQQVRADLRKKVDELAARY